MGVEQMQVDLEADGASVGGLARFQQELFHERRLRQAGIGLTTLALSGWILALFVALFAPVSIWPVVLINCASALLLLVAGLQSAWWVADWRAQALEVPRGEAVEGVWGAMEPKTNVSSESHRKGAFRSPAHPPGITL